MNNFEKKLKAGLKKCPLHRFGSEYDLIRDGWFECKKCHGFHFIDFSKDKFVNITPFNLGIKYKFK